MNKNASDVTFISDFSCEECKNILKQYNKKYTSSSFFCSINNDDTISIQKINFYSNLASSIFYGQIIVDKNITKIHGSFRRIFKPRILLAVIALVLLFVLIKDFITTGSFNYQVVLILLIMISIRMVEDWLAKKEKLTIFNFITEKLNAKIEN